MSASEQADPGRPGSDPIGLGLLIGTAVGIGEVLVRIGIGYTAVTRLYLFESALIYGSVGALIGVGLRALALVRRGGVSGPTCVAVIVSCFVFMMLAGVANIYWLPDFMHWKSLTASGAMLVGSVVLALVLSRLFGAFAARRAGAGVRRGRWSVAGLVLLALAGLASLPFGERGGASAGSATDADWNVVLILVDTLRADHLSIYGYERETSPQIDAWARRGVVFDHAMSHSSWTKPSTASILTSLYPSTHRVSGAGSGLPPSAEPLAEILKRNGFRTALFTGNSYVTPVFGFDQGVDFFWGEDQPRLRQLILGHVLHMARPQHSVIRATYEGMVAIERGITGHAALPKGKVRAEAITRRFWSWLDGLGDDERFFAYLHFVDPHSPYEPPPPYDRHFMPERFAEPWTEGPGSWQGLREYGATPDGLEQLIALYDGEILYLDHWIGQVIRDLERRGLFEKTLVLFTADHGEEFADHGDFGHGNSLYQEQLHVALMMSFPDGLVRQGRRFPHVVRHVDVLPTVLDVLGLPIPQQIAGRSLLPIVRGEEPEHPSRVVFSEVDRRVQAVALQSGSHKVIRENGDLGHRTLAFDLASDDDEQQNLAENASPWRDALITQLEQLQRGAAQGAIPELEVRVDEATEERLRALGYVD